MSPVVPPVGDFSGLSLWLVPRDRPSSEDELKSLRRVMSSARDDVAAEYGENFVSGPFEPHVTLLAGLSESDGWTRKRVWDVTRKVLERNAGNLTPLLCPLEDVVTRGLYFQCIVIALEKARDLMSLNEAVRRAFGINAEEAGPYFPHCSLIYAHLDERQAREKISAMERDGVFARNPSGRGITIADTDHIALRAVELWDSNGPVENWRKLEEFIL